MAGPKGILNVKKEYFDFEGLTLESGIDFGPLTLAYETMGALNQDKSNAILVCHALTGDSHVAGYYGEYEKKPGWWDIMVGPGKPIDTRKYYVICSNILGGCMGSTGPSSINPRTGEPYGLDFPVVTVRDMVNAQARLVEHLGVERIYSVIGGSLGGMQVLSWCYQYPGKVRSAVALATTMRHSALAIAFNEVARQAIVSDPNWNKGHYYGKAIPSTGLSVARMIGHITYLSDESMHQKFGRKLQGKEDFSFDFETDFQVESYLRHQGAKFVDRFDANSLLYITKAADFFDLTKYKESEEVFLKLKKGATKFLVVSYTSDWLYPTYQSREIVKALKRNNMDVSFCEIEADCGHDAFLLPSDRLANMMTGFLSGVSTLGERKNP